MRGLADLRFGLLHRQHVAHRAVEPGAAIRGAGPGALVETGQHHHVGAHQARLEQAMADKREHTLAELQELMGLPSPEPLYWILRHLCANRRHIDVRGDWGNPESLVFTHD